MLLGRWCLIEKQILQNLFNFGVTAAHMTQILHVDANQIHYWIRKYRISNKITRYKCSCGETEESKFQKTSIYACRKCRSILSTKLKAKNKQLIVDHLGGKCLLCGYNKCNPALAIHHRDPDTKEDNFMFLTGMSWSKVEKQIKNCVLLCHNCHMEIHAGVTKLPNT